MSTADDLATVLAHYPRHGRFRDFPGLPGGPDQLRRLADRIRAGAAGPPCPADPQPRHDPGPAEDPRGDLYRAFGRRRRLRLPGGCGVLAAADDGVFVGLQLLAASLLLSHDAPLAVVDLGLSRTHRAWLRRNGAAVLDPPGLAMPPTTPAWQNWNKPLYLAASPFRRTLWLDVDILVGGDLGPLFAAIAAGPLLVGDHFVAHEGTDNRPGFYRDYPVRGRLLGYCSGVIGVAAGRAADEAWLAESARLLRRAAADPGFRGEVAFWDQGIMAAAAGRLGLRPDRRRDWNCPGRPLAELSWRAASAAELLSRRPAATVVHYQGSSKPWAGWRPLDLDLSAPAALRVFVLGHDEAGLAGVPPRPFLEPINLSARDPDQAAAENRFYDQLPAGWDATEYVGLASWQWDRKWAGYGHLPLAELHRLAPRLRPGRVVAALKTGRPDVPPYRGGDYADAMDHHHPGIRRYIDELRRATGRAEVQPSLWSQNFIAHRDVVRDFLAFHRRWMAHFRARYGPQCEGMDFPHTPPRRPAAWAGEFVCCHYFASRPDLEIAEARDDGPREQLRRLKLARACPDFDAGQVGCAKRRCRRTGEVGYPADCLDCEVTMTPPPP
jgi:hypothetical protein